MRYKLFIISLWLFISIQHFALGQLNISGPTVVSVNEEATYNIVNGQGQTPSNVIGTWVLPNGAEQVGSATNTQIRVRWLAGAITTRKLRYYRSTGTLLTLDVGILPNTPDARISESGCFGAKTLNVLYETPPPDGVTWYWQTSTTGTSENHPHTSSYIVSSSGTYYLRAKNNIGWSVNSKAFSISIYQDFTLNIGNQIRCGEGTFTFQNATSLPQNGTIRWYESEIIGGNTVYNLLHEGATFTSPILPAGQVKSYYASYYHTEALCEGAKFPFSANVKVVPNTPTFANTLNVFASGGAFYIPVGSPIDVSQYKVYTDVGLTNLLTTIELSQDLGCKPMHITGMQICEPALKRYYHYTANQDFILPASVATGTKLYIVAVKDGCTGPSQEVTLTRWDAPQVQRYGSMLTNTGAFQVLLKSETIFDEYIWTRNDEFIAGSTSSNLLVKQAGAYRAWVRKGNDWGRSQTFTITEADLSNTVGLSNTLLHYSAINVIREPIQNESELQQGLSIQTAYQQINYVNGLGRAEQTIVPGVSPSGADAVITGVNEAFGKNTKSYLPYSSSIGAGYRPNAIKENYTQSEQYQFYQNTAVTGLPPQSKPFSEIVIETSPSGRVLEAGDVGETYQIQPNEEGKTMKSKWRFWNLADGQVRYFQFDLNTKQAVSTDFYNSNELIISEVKDPQGNKAWSFTNIMGQTVMTRTQVAENDYAETYFIYDEFGQLRITISPEGTDALKANSWLLNTNILNKWCFVYDYDKYGRGIYAKVPGIDPTETIYNQRGEVVMSQDGKMRQQGKWAFVKYDRWGRSIMNGTLTETATRQTLQNQADAFTGAAHETRQSNNFATQHGYSNVAYPVLTGDTTILTVSYYDDYDFDNNPATTQAVYKNCNINGVCTEDILEKPNNEPLRGYTTGSKVRVKGTNNWMLSTVFYDEFGRAIQSYQENHLGGSERMYSFLNFEGQVLKTVSEHQSGLPANAPVTIATEYFYDHVGRLLYREQQINQQPKKRLLELNYNELGQVKSQLVGRANNQKPLQKIDYKYDLQGRMLEMNDWAGVQNDASTAYAADLFAMKFHFDDVAGLPQGATARYDGNMAGVSWRSSLDGVNRSYHYEYDVNNRLKNAYYSDNEQATGNQAKNFFEGNLTYDKNGNILTLTRKGWNNSDKANRTYGVIDDLKYLYDGNQLVAVEDLANDQNATFKGFVNGKNQVSSLPSVLPARNQGLGGLEQEYFYDVNGNLTTDKNKDILSITYNEWNKPEEVILTNNRRATYIYDGGGNVLKKQIFENGSLKKTTDYVGGFVYEQSKLAFIHTVEGRALAEYNAGNVAFVYEYAYTDHQGNTRMLFREGKTTTRETNLDDGNTAGFRNYNETQSNQYSKAGGIHSSKTQPSQPLGVYKQLQVRKGDKIKAWAYAKYLTDATQSRPTSVSVTISNTGLTPPQGEQGSTEPNWTLGLSFSPNFDNLAEPTVPQSSLKLLLYDTEGKLLDSKLQAITSEAKTNANWEKLELTWQMPEDGILQVLTTNESNVEVFYDNVGVENEEQMITQENHYYPFGLEMEGLGKKGSPAYPYLYNAGTELESSFGLSWYETPFRRLDPALGRFWGVDALASIQPSETPYHYASNNPIMYNDPTGLYKDPYQAWQGNMNNMSDLSYQGGFSFYSNGTPVNYQWTWGVVGEATYVTPKPDSRSRDGEEVHTTKKLYGWIGSVAAPQGFGMMGDDPSPGPCIECYEQTAHLGNLYEGQLVPVRVMKPSHGVAFDNYLYRYDGKNWIIQDWTESTPKTVGMWWDQISKEKQDATKDKIKSLSENPNIDEDREKDRIYREWFKKNYNKIKTSENAIKHAAAIGKIAEKYKVFQCKECAEKIVLELKKLGVNGEILNIETIGKKGMGQNIWSDKMGQNISTNGQHRAIRIGSTVFDNINPYGVDYEKWKDDLFSPNGYIIHITSF